jgi:RHS repeat-associated protein
VYNHLNLPTVINFSGGSNIVYTYDATGVKLKKIVEVVSPIGYSESKVASSTEPTNKAANTIAPPPPPPPPLTITTTTTEYLNGFQYTNEELQFFPTAEGYVKYTKKALGGKKWILYSYIYNYTDHLGNIRLSYSKDPTTHETDVVEEQHYYPFGLEHPYNKIERDLIFTWNLTLTFGQTTENGYQYQYNGKEWQDEMGYNMYDMDMRQYDPAIARWVVQDPIVHHGMSPYNAFDNNPVFWADPSGADAIYNEKTGQYVINGKVVSFAEALAYAQSGGNSDGSNNNEPDENLPPDIIFSDKNGNEIYRIEEPWWADTFGLEDLNITLNGEDISNGGFFAYVLEIGGTGHSFLLDLATGYYWEASHPRDAEGKVIPLKENLTDGDGVKSVIMKRNINDSDFWTNNAGGEKRGNLKVFPIFVPNKNTLLSLVDSTSKCNFLVYKIIKNIDRFFKSKIFSGSVIDFLLYSI